MDSLTQLLLTSSMPSDDEFEWHHAKARSNYAKHGVTFDTAKRAFADPLAVEVLDDSADYGEDRFLLIGMVDGQLLSIVYTHGRDATVWLRRGGQREMSKTTTSRRTAKAKPDLAPDATDERGGDPAAARALTGCPAARHRRQLARMKHTPRAKLIRRALGLDARRVRRPLFASRSGTLRDWEQGASERTRRARAYLTVIARNPEGGDQGVDPRGLMHVRAPCIFPSESITFCCSA